MKANLDHLTELPLFSVLSTEALATLQPHTQLQCYEQKEIIFSEGDWLPEKLYILLSGVLQVQKSTAAGKETILRSIRAGDLLAAPGLFGDQQSTNTISVIEDCQILTIPKTALLKTIQQTPELTIQFLVMFNQRLQQLHNMVHGLVSERAVVRLAQMIQYSALQQGTASVAAGEQLRIKLPYYQMARSIGVAYEECARLMKGLGSVVKYSRGGKIVILDPARLAAIASGERELDD